MGGKPFGCEFFWRASSLSRVLWLQAILLFIGLSGVASAQPNTGTLEKIYRACSESEAMYKERSTRLKKIYDEDQADRQKPSVTAGSLQDNYLRPGIQWRDRRRRMEVGKIFGEGCFKKAEDYYRAAMVFQHGGDTVMDDKTGLVARAPDHFFQAFIWAKRAVDLGMDGAKWLVAASADRYLWFLGKKQIFGTQFFRTFDQACICSVPIEESFPDAKRMEFTGKDKQQALQHLRDFTGQKDCPLVYCDFALKDSGPGSLPGFW